MNIDDRSRLEWLMRHYGIPMNQSHQLLDEERDKYPAGVLPSKDHRTDREDNREFEGVFFCRVINEQAAEIARLKKKIQDALAEIKR